MKLRSFVLLLSCVTFATFVIFLFGDSRPRINHFVTQTQTKINSWRNGKVSLIRENNNLHSAEKYLPQLGFTVGSFTYHPHFAHNIQLPVFVTAVSSDDIDFIPRYVASFQSQFPDYILLIYTLNFSPSEISQVYASCNSSSCSVRLFDFNSYPAHVQDLKLSAYRPIIIQEVLHQNGAVLWLDIQYIFTSNGIKILYEKAKKEGVVSWTINHPTSSLTHPHMFEYFETNQENFFFHRMVQPSYILLYNKRILHRELMLPWVSCALVADCIAPIGSQNSGCRFDKKPLYRYSGCHGYDMSALNVALGIMFDYSSNRYAAKEEEKIFHHIEFQIKEATTTYDNIKNTTIFSDI